MFQSVPIIRPITQDDLPKLLWSDQEKELSEFHQQLFEEAKLGKIFFMVADIDGNIAGRIRITPYTVDGNPWISGLQVKEDMRNKGIGTKLMEKAEAVLKLLGSTSVCLTVNIKNTDALRLYKKLGYTILSLGTQTWTYPKQGKQISVSEDVYFMMKKLE